MTPAPGDYFDDAAADRAVRFIEQLLHLTQGTREPFILEPFQRDDIIRPLFGWKRADGLRKYRTAYIELPRKNGKSNLAAAIALLLLYGDQEPGAQIVSAAGSRDQARIVFTIARQMVQQSPPLAARSTVHRNEIHHGGSFYRSISAEAGTAHGLNLHGLVADELHTWRGRELWDTLTTAQGSRSQPLTVAITTAGQDPASVCRQVHEYAQDVRSGVIDDPTFLPIIYAADPDDDWTSPKTWAKANPGLGRIVRADYLEEAVRKAKATPSLVNTFKRLHLNIWTSSESAWLTDEDFQRGAHPIPWERLRQVPCWGGLDLASTRDLTAFALVWHLDGITFTLVHQFVNEETAQTAKLTYGTDYLTWAEAGHITITPGNVTSFTAVRDHILEAAQRWNLQAVAYDRKFSPYIVPELIAAGLDMQPFGQGFLSMNEPTKWVEMETVAGRLHHDGNPVLRWQLSCVVLDRDPADNVKVSKNRGKKGQKVDGVVALIMAAGLYLAEGKQPAAPDFSQILSL